MDHSKWVGQDESGTHATWPKCVSSALLPSVCCLVLLLQLILTAINTARSAFFAVTFYASFFDAYSIECSLDKVQSAVLLKVRVHIGLGKGRQGERVVGVRPSDKVQVRRCSR